MDATELQNTFSANLKAARIRAHLSQLKLAEQAGLSVGYVCDLENGRRWGTPDTFSRLARALNIRPYELLVPSKDEHNDRQSTSLERFSEDVLSQITTIMQETLCRYQ